MGLSERCKAFVLRLPSSAKLAATAVSKAEGISLNHFISMAVAEKLVRYERTRPSQGNDLPKPNHSQPS
jgi:hypothetical protein